MLIKLMPMCILAATGNFFYNVSAGENIVLNFNDVETNSRIPKSLEVMNKLSFPSVVILFGTSVLT